MARTKTKTASQPAPFSLYDQAQPGMLATTTTGKIGIITEKFMSVGGMPHIWLQEPGAALTPKPIDLIAKVENKPYAVILFSGGGGVEAGMIEAGIEPILAVEYDPDKPELSEALAASHEANFPRCKVIRRTVSECAADDFPGFPLEPDILWASPVCANFSVAKNGKEQPSDIEAASAVVTAIKKLKPKHFFLENVPAYQKSESWKQIELILPTLGYRVTSSIVDMSDYGVPQARVRFIAIASVEGKPLPLPFKQPATGWYDAIADLIPKLPESQLLKGQQRSVDNFLATNAPTLMLIDRSGGRGGYRAVPSYKPANTIMRSHFTDGKNANRTKFADIWLPDGTVKSVSIECIRRLQSFPDWYQLPEQIGVAGSILGYSVPPKFVELLLEPLACRADNPNPIEEGHSYSNGLNGDSQIKSGEYTGLSIAEIRRDGGTQPREKLDLNHIATLSEAIEDGAELDPVIVFYDGSDYWLADGFHRCKASEESGLEDIPVVIHQGTRRDAILYSVGANAEHKAAKPRSRADKRRAVTMLLNDPEWSKWSDREIARQCKVSNFFVSKLRRDSLTVINHSENEDSENEAKTRTYTTKHGTTATMQTGNIGKKDDLLTESASWTPIQGEEFAADGNGNGNGNGEMETDKTKPTIDPNDYAIAFMTNINHINPDLLKEARKRIDQRLTAIDKPST
ncbi:DNA cytosine methyltransferase [Coleofasciculus sp.]|uniref:DNA cytosine methyltransferase n=1 Tax=Coleofasciculus sp. TaxID=3100458 RepID=UPI0039FA3995